MSDNRQNAGSVAEQLAEDYLCQAGLKPVARNYRCRMGEIDLVMQDQGCLVFVEVRLRTRPQFGGAAASIHPYKQARIVKAAQHYLSGLPTSPTCRFDAILLDALDTSRIEWLKNAFDA